MLLAIATVTTVASRDRENPFASVPKGQRIELTKRLAAYTTAFRKKDWASLYDLVSDVNKIGLDDKLKVSKPLFVRDMQDTYDSRRLIRFTPVRTDVVISGMLNIYGCGVVPYGNEKDERIAAVRAVREHGNWFFTDWDYADPPEPCSHLSDRAWKARNLRLDGPMLQVSCELNTCEL